MWQERAERIVVTASSDHFARLDEAQWILAKVGMIVSNLEHKGMILNEEITTRPPKERLKMERYLRLLEGLDLVRQAEEGYTYGNLFSELRRVTDSYYEFKVAILSHVIRERYAALKELFGISQLETFVHVDSCYYRPALEAEDILYWTRDSIINCYTELYGRKSPLRLTYILGELVNAEALRYEDKYYFGDEKLFGRMLDIKGKMPEIISPIRA
jgi:hypothetical protein